MRPFKLSLGLATAALLLLGAGCASMGGSDNGDQNVLTGEELREVSANNLHQAVERLRPRWLQSRGSRSLGGGTSGADEIAVFRGSSYLGGVDELRSMGTDGIEELRYMDASLANARLSAPRGISMAGAIVVDN